MSSLEDLAKNVKAAQEVIDRVSQILADAGRSAVIEVKNASSQTIRAKVNNGGHSHGGFAPGSLPADHIDAGQANVFGSKSSEGAVGTGTTGSVFYLLDDEGTTLHVRWVVPWIGGNEAHSNVTGPHADWYESQALAGGGSKKVSIRFILGEKASLQAMQPDWRPCGECKTLVYSLDPGICPGRIHRKRRPVVVGNDMTTIGGEVTYLPHQPAGDVFQLPHSPGPAREGGWRKCRRCKSLFYDGWESKGACPNWAEPRPGHVAEDGGHDYMLQFNTLARPSQQNDWRFCTKCYVLFYFPQNEDGDCAAGGTHHAHEYNYVIDRVSQ